MRSRFVRYPKQYHSHTPDETISQLCPPTIRFWPPLSGLAVAMTRNAPVLISARRSAIGRVGGLHRSRRIEELAAPVLGAAIKDAALAIDRFDGLMLGNSSAGGNPARAIGLAAGLPARAAASTIDSACASGLEAIILAVRRIEAGDAGILAAGGADSLSTAPWRIARPRNAYQLPRFIGAEGQDSNNESHQFDPSEALARQLNITREAQDEYALKSHLRAELSREKRRFVGEIHAIRANADEARDQSITTPSAADLSQLPAFLPPDGTLTPGNASSPADGAAFAVIVSHSIWLELGSPPGLTLLRSMMLGVSPDASARAAVAAVESLLGHSPIFKPANIEAVEMSEASAVEALALIRLLGFDKGAVNTDGGALVRGHPIAAAGAVSVCRLFSRLIRSVEQKVLLPGTARLGLAAQTATGGLGIAALFEAVGED